jgi:hypothetical protein
MNELLKDLEKRSVFFNEEDSVFEFDREKFAELIVRECANRASWAQDTNEADIGGEVLKHFGVEE